MQRFLFSLAVVLIAALTVLSGIVHGRMSNRWGPSPDTLAAAAKLAEIPQRFGDWRQQGADELDKSSRDELQPAGYFVRRYENRQTGDIVSVTLLLGRPGPISVHTPEVCLAAGTTKPAANANKWPLPVRAGQPTSSGPSTTK